MQPRLIVTADDYGMCDSVNKAIEACLAAHTTRATCVMTNMPAYHAAALLRTRFPRVSIGIHWTLTQGQPVLPGSQVPSLVDADGRFHSRSRFRAKWLTKKVKRAECEAELCAQFQRHCEVAGMPDFWNTHQDVHLLPGLFRTCVALGLELGIPAMRCHRRITVSRDHPAASHNLRHPVSWIKSQVIAQWSGHAEAQGVFMPDGKVFLRGYDMSQAAIEEAMGRLPWASVGRAAELIIHPATVIEEDLFHIRKELRIREYQVFGGPELGERLRRRGIQTVGFEALGGER